MNLNQMKKEDLELLSYTRIAELYLKEHKKPMTTSDLFHEVCKLLELGEKDYQNLIADFFQSLTTSKEFILLDSGKWDLRDNHIVKVQVDDDEEEENSSDEDSDNDDATIEDDNLDEDFNSVDNNYDDTNDDLSDLTIVDEEDMDE